MKHLGVIILILILGSGSAFAAVGTPQPTSHSQSASLSASVDLPTWYPGDTWTYSIDPLYSSGENGTFSGTVENFQQTVVGVHDDVYDLTVSADISGTFTSGSLSGDLTGTITGTSTTRRSDLAQGASILASSGTITPDFPPIPLPYTADVTYASTPLLELFDFPLNVGDQWHIHCQSTTTGSIDISGLLDQSLDGNQTIDEDVSCPQQATITVPAGSFTSFEIARDTTDGWYSSEAGNLVKSTIDQSDANGTVHAVLTLQSFNRSIQPLTVSENLSPSVLFPGESVIVSGRCLNAGTGTPVINAAVTVTIPATGDSWTTSTNNNGDYTYTFDAPVVQDDTPSGRETGSSGVVVLCHSGSLDGYCVRTLTTLGNTPPLTPSINGPATGKAGEKYTCAISSTDAEHDDLMYLVDWGDNTTQWIGPSASGANITATHTYTNKGMYLIRAMAKDSHGAESAWGSLQVKMPLSFSYQPRFRFFERFPHAFLLLRLFLQAK